MSDGDVLGQALALQRDHSELDRELVEERGGVLGGAHLEATNDGGVVRTGGVVELSDG